MRQITPAPVTRPEITALAERHISASPSWTSFFLKMGMNAAVNAPSPSSRRNRLGTWNERANALATQLLPMKAAYTISRNMPSTRLVMVATAIAPEDLSICDILRAEHKEEGLKSKVQS